MSDYRSLRRTATLLLLLMAALFAWTLTLPTDLWWRGWVKAFAEAAMVGGLADWFAVSALFRHPLGIPFPHSAILPRNKMRIAKNLSSFIEENFLDPSLVASKLAGADLGASLSTWMRDERNAALIADRASTLLPILLEAISYGEVRRLVEDAASEGMSRIDFSPIASRFVETLVAENRHEAIVGEILRIGQQMIYEHREEIRRSLAKERPWFMPSFVDDMLSDRIVRSLQRALEEMERAPSGEARRRYSERIAAWMRTYLAADVIWGPSGFVRREIVENESVRQYVGEVIDELRVQIDKDLSTTHSLARVILTRVVMRAGEVLDETPKLRASVTGWIARGVVEILRAHQKQITSFFYETVARWDTATLVDKFERELGPDLQFIRMNGTVVGGLVGVVIHALQVLNRV